MQDRCDRAKANSRLVKIHADTSHAQAKADFFEPVHARSSWQAAAIGQKPKKRVRQSSKPEMNKLETEFNSWLGFDRPSLTRRPQAVTFKLANGVRYTPDFYDTETLHAWEVKGSHKGSMRDDASVKLKVFAKEYPEIEVILAWKDSTGQWCQQTILP